MAKRVLIADDSVTIQRAFAMTFAAEDFNVHAARSADEALTVARQMRPDFVIADAVMPGRSGYELCAAIKSDAALRGIPVYILASSHNPYDEIRGRQSGVDGHLLKPFDSTALVERIKEAIAKGTTNDVAPAAAASGRRPTPVEEAYGELSIETPPGRHGSAIRDGARSAFPAVSAPTATPPRGRPLTPAGVGGQGTARSFPTQVPGAATPGAALRPSLIPGVRPGAVPAHRPGAVPGRPSAGSSAGVASANAPTSRAPIPQIPPATTARTLMGVPAAGAVVPARPSFAVPARPGVRPGLPGTGAAGASVGASSPTPAVTMSASAATAAVSSAIDQKIASVAARGPEYEAIAKLSRDVIEKIVWEIVPELAETIIREELQKRGRTS